jgi:dihydroorotase
MNPPIRGAQHRRGLWRALEARVVDVIGSDHAPHTREEKANAYPNTPSGMPGVQTLVPVLLNHVAAGRLTLERLVELTSEAPAHLFGISGKHGVVAGSDADLTLVDLGAKREITDSWIASRCGWTPFDGMQVTGWPRATIIGGRIVMRDDEVLGEPAGAPMQFNF